MDMNKIEKLKQYIDESSKIVFFGGAGVSTESGIPDFRSAEGLYSEKGTKYKPEDILSHGFFYKHTEEFYKFYRDKMLYPNVKPNITHNKLVELEKNGKLLGIITQNIDGLHQMAGSKNVAELHGTVYVNHCTRCNKEYSLDEILSMENIPKCTCGGIIKPDVTLYDEQLPKEAWNNAYNWMTHADMLIVAGTSLSVYPAANLIYDFCGKHIVLINKQKISMNHLSDGDLVFECGLGEVLKYL